MEKAAFLAVEVKNRTKRDQQPQSVYMAAENFAESRADPFYQSILLAYAKKEVLQRQPECNGQQVSRVTSVLFEQFVCRQAVHYRQKLTFCAQIRTKTLQDSQNRKAKSGTTKTYKKGTTFSVPPYYDETYDETKAFTCDKSNIASRKSILNKKTM